MAHSRASGLAADPEFKVYRRSSGFVFLLADVTRCPCIFDNENTVKLTLTVEKTEAGD